ncbi:DNA polymerase/3'-5' exonuclease PolX [Candidatus Dojkabacteria bacterium]|nr:DNA polymerase/3'-5' exonuclease PolX [Candidatus Dojkabacteria bacterium]
MIIHNKEIAEKLEEMANLLGIKGANEYRVRSYRNAALTVRRQSRRIQNMLEEDKDLTQLSNIGESIAEKIKEIVNTGESSFLSSLKEKIPPDLLDILEIKGMGPKRVQKLYDELDIKSKKELEKALNKGKVKNINGFGKKTTKNLKTNLKKEESNNKRTILKQARNLILPFCEYLERLNEVQKLHLAGSYRRKKETVGDIDILILSSKRQIVIDHFTDYEEVEKIISKGETRSTVKLKTGILVDLRVIKEKSEGAALLYFTGSKSHNVTLRKIAQDDGYKINEYGIFQNNKRINKSNESEIYQMFGFEYIPPELRENRGEFEASKNNNLPKLIQLKDIKGDVQMHTTQSDAENTITEMAKKCRKLGYEYIAVTDHSGYIGVTQGLKDDEIPEQIERITKINENFENIEILSGMEVDVLEDGKLDLSDEVLKKLDVVLFSIHSHFNLSSKKQTDRILKAMDNPYVNIFAHPTGRKIGKRDPYSYDIEKILKRAKANNIIMEINASPARLDLNDIHSKRAKEIGVKMVISTDAHSINELNYMKYGVWQARRGWLEKEDVINTKSVEKFKKALKK